MHTDSLVRAPAPTLGGRIAAARRAAGLTQEQLGLGLGPEGADLGKGTISSWEVDRTQPSPNQVALLASRLGVSGNYLLGLPDVARWDGRTERRRSTRQAAR